MDLNKLRTLRAEKVAAFEQTLNASTEENRDLTADETAAINSIEAEIKGIDEKISVHQRLLDLKAQAPSLGATTIHAPSVMRRAPVNKTLEQGETLGQLVRCQAMAHTREDRIAYAVENKMADVVVQAVSTDSGSAGAVVNPQIYNEVIPFLRERSVVRLAGPTSYPLLPGVGSIRLPRVSTGSTAAWVGENTTVNRSNATVDYVELNPKKLAVNIPMSKEVFRRSTPAIDIIIRNDMVNAIAAKENSSYLIDASGGAGPTGLMNQVSASSPDHIISTSNTVNLANTVSSLNAAVTALKTARVPMIQPTWFFSPRTEGYLRTLTNAAGHYMFQEEMGRGLLMGYRFFSVPSIPNNGGAGTNESKILLVDMSEVLHCEVQAADLEVSTTAVYNNGGTLLSAWDLDQIVMKLTVESDIKLKHAVSGYVIDAVTWA